MARKKRFLRILTLSMGLLAIVAILLAIAAKFWIVPAVVRWEVNKALADQWDGPATIDEVEFNYFSPIYLRGLNLSDRSGRRWLSVKSVKLTLRGFPGTSPVLAGVDVNGVSVRAHFKDGKCIPPILTPPPREKPTDLGKYIDLDGLTVRDVTAAIVDDAEGQFVTGRLNVNVVRKDGVYTVRADWGRQDDTHAMSVTGKIDAGSGKTRLTVRILQPVESAEVAKIAKIVAGGRVVAGRGLIDGTIKITGDIHDPADLRPVGLVLLKGFRATSKIGVLFDNFTAAVQISRGKLIQVTLPNLAMGLCGGRVVGNVTLMFDPSAREKPFSYALRLAADSVDMPHLLYVVTGTRNMRSGKLHGAITVSGRGTEIRDIKARGAGIVRPIHITGNPLFDAILGSFDLRSEQLAVGSTFRCKFRMKDGLVLIDRASLGHPLLSLAVMPVGKVNVPKHRLDLYVIGGPFNLLSKVPIIGRLSKQWFRLHVTGTLDDPKVGKEVLKDIPQGVMDLFSGAIVDTRSLGGGLLNLLKSVGGEKNGTNGNDGDD